MKTKDLRQFATDLRQWSREFPDESLREYSRRLSERLENFDDRLPETIAEFPRVILAIERGR